MDFVRSGMLCTLSARRRTVDPSTTPTGGPQVRIGVVCQEDGTFMLFAEEEGDPDQRIDDWLAGTNGHRRAETRATSTREKSAHG